MHLGKLYGLIMFNNNPFPHYQCLYSDIVKDLLKKEGMIKTKELKVRNAITCFATGFMLMCKLFATKF